MGILDFFNKQTGVKREDGEEVKERLNSIFRKVSDLSAGSSKEEIRYISAFSGLLGRVAYSDLDISDEEISKIKKILKKATSLSENEIKIISEIVVSEIKALTGLENHLYTAEVNKLATRNQKEELMVALFLVAAADENISSEENEEIRTISKALGFTHADFAEFRSMFKKYLSEFK